MKHFVDVLNILILLISIISLAWAETRYVCVRRAIIGGIGMDDMEHELDEAFEADDMHEMDEGGGAGPMIGTLDCSSKPQTVILVTKLIYGFGGPAGCSSPDETCDQEAFSDREISPMCDGQIKCVINARPQILPKCVGRRSDFIHVEYECIKPDSIYQICKESTTTIKVPYFFVQSPDKAHYPKGGYAMCECIMKSMYSDGILMEYTHINMIDPNAGQPGVPRVNNAKCGGNYVLFESRSKPNQTRIDNRLQVCGRKTVSNKIFKGSLRVTFASKSMFADEGFLTKFQVKRVNGASMVNMQCGKVTLPPNSPLLTKSGQPTGYINNVPFGPAFGPGPVPPGVLPPPYWRWQLQQPNPFFPTQFNGPPFRGRGTPRAGGKDDDSSKNQKPSRKWDSNTRTATPSTLGLPPSLDFIGRNRDNRVNPAKAQQANIEVTEKKENKDNSSSGQVVAYAVGGSGAALAAICAIIVVLVYSRRKKHYVRHRDVNPMASFRNSGRRRVEIDVDSVYTSPAEVDERRQRMSTQSHNNAAYISDPPERRRGRTNIDTEGYSTVGLASHDHVEEAEVVNARSIVGHDYDNNFRR